LENEIEDESGNTNNIDVNLIDLKIEDLSENYYTYTINPITPINYEPTLAIYLA